MTTVDRLLTVKEVAQRWSTTQHLVLARIRSGQLEARDISDRQSKNPRWRVTLSALERFEKGGHRVQPRPERTAPKRKPQAVPSFLEQGPRI